MDETRPAQVPGSSAHGGDYRMGREHEVGEPFRSFYAHFGQTLCGLPVSGVLVEGGRRCQYFEHLALEEVEAGRVRLKPLGRAWMEAAAESATSTASAPPRPRITDVSAELPKHPARSYPTRPLADIRYLVLHHTGAAGHVDVRAIAQEHVRVNDWPGIGYHFVIGDEGTVLQTQDLTTVSYHARQFNPASVGIALSGDLSAALPTSEQMDALATLLASLVIELGLGPSSIRGHREMVATPCPGDTFLGLWKPRLMRMIAQQLDPTSSGDLVPSAGPTTAASPDAEAVQRMTAGSDAGLPPGGTREARPVAEIRGAPPAAEPRNPQPSPPAGIEAPDEDVTRPSDDPA